MHYDLALQEISGLKQSYTALKSAEQRFRSSKEAVAELKATPEGEIRAESRAEATTVDFQLAKAGKKVQTDRMTSPFAAHAAPSSQLPSRLSR